MSASTPRVSRVRLEHLKSELSGRDLAILGQVAELKLMSGRHIEAVHFPLLDHATVEAGARACRRVLARLVRDRLLVRLQRQVGGLRGGSAGFVYGLAELGQRVLNMDGPRKRFREPSATFVAHTLAISQLVVDLIDRQATKDLELLQLQPEPRCWRTFTGMRGQSVLRPDLFVALASGEYEYRWFVEIDLGTETMPRRLIKCAQYQSYFQSGSEQADHGIFPKIVWSMPNKELADALRVRIQRSSSLTTELFMVTTPEHLLDTLRGGKS